MAFIVAEIGINWDGNFTLLKEMMQNSKNSGCSAIKLQAFREETVQNHPEKERLLRSSITNKNIEQINEIAKDVQIEWFCTPMYAEAIDFLDSFVKRYKIRELDGRLLLENKMSPIVQKALNTGKEVIVSSHSSPHNSRYFKNKHIKWLYCVPKYPCELNELNFSNIRDFDGYSNHSTELIAPITASILGAKIIEIHLTSDKRKNFIDNNVSLDYQELKDVINYIRISEEIKK